MPAKRPLPLSDAALGHKGHCLPVTFQMKPDQQKQIQQSVFLVLSRAWDNSILDMFRFPGEGNTGDLTNQSAIGETNVGQPNWIGDKFQVMINLQHLLAMCS